MLISLGGPLSTIRMSPQGEDGSGGGTGGTAPSGDPNEGAPESFTKEQVEDIVRKRLASQVRKTDEAEHRYQEAIAAKEQLQADFDAYRESHEGESDPDRKLQGEFDLLKAQTTRQIEELKDELDAAKKEAVSERDQRLESQRQQALLSALQTHVKVDGGIKAGQAIFDKNVVWDEVYGKWMFQPEGKDSLVEIDAGVEEYLPDYLKAAPAPGGGSGAPGGSPKQRKHDELKRLNDEITRAEKKVRASGGNQSALMTARTLRKKRDQLQAELAD